MPLAKLSSADGLDEFVEICLSDVVITETASKSQESLSSSALGSVAIKSCG